MQSLKIWTKGKKSIHFCVPYLLMLTVPYLYTGDKSTPVGYIGKVLEGFTISTKKLKTKRGFGPPNIPKDFKPIHKFRKTLESINEHLRHIPGTSEGPVIRPKKLDAVSRGLALGESPVIGKYIIIRQLLKTSSRSIHQQCQALVYGSLWPICYFPDMKVGSEIVLPSAKFYLPCATRQPLILRDHI